MDRVTALQSYQEAVSGKITEFRNNIGEYLLKHAQELEDLVKNAMELLGKEMEKQGKEYVSFLYFSLLKTDFIRQNHRFLLHGLDMRWYMDEEPAEVYIDAGELLEPFSRLWDALLEQNQGYGGVINSYDIQNLLFEQMEFFDSTASQILRYRLRSWEENGIFDPVPRPSYWILKWGEYRDRSEILVRVDRTEKETSVWKKEISRAAHEPEAMVCGYWYKGNYEGSVLDGLDMRFTVFEECSLENITFRNCNLEGSRFPKTGLAGCRFENCNLWGADFRGSRFQQTFFGGSELTAAVFPAKSIPFLDISAGQLQALYLEREEGGK